MTTTHRQVRGLTGALALLALFFSTFASNAQAAICEIDGDGDIDINDINLILAARGMDVDPGDPRDANSNGVIGVGDARACVLMCTLPRCAEPVAEPPVAPAVDAGPDDAIDEGSAFASAGNFIDPNTDTWVATVDYGAGAGPQALALNPDKTFALNNVYADDGVFTVIVTVTDDDGGVGSDTVVVVVNNVPPSVDAGPDAAIEEGDAFVSGGVFIDPGASDTWTATVDYGAGAGPQPLALNPDNSFALGNVYPAAGVFTVIVTVTDDDGGVGANAAMVSVAVAQVVVPDVVGLSQGAAEAAITGAGLVVGVVSNANSDVVPAGDVSAQNPGGGAFAAPASAVDITVSDGPADVVVPDVVGLSQGAAEAAITGAGLVVGVVSNANSDVVPAGDVSAQNPGGGAFAAPASAVDITVSDGPADVVVPDVVGLSQGAAEAAITGAGLVVGVVSNANSDVVPAGDVSAQNPGGGAFAAPASAVDITVSDGPADVVVPDVVGLSQGAAEAAITGAGLVVGVVSNANSDVVPAGDVSAQNPGGGAFAAPASAVDITVSDGPADVVVPDVVGLSQGAAEAAITGAGLVVGVVSNANSDVVPAGDVSAQNPGGGAFAAPASAVDITVSDGPADVVVPDVVGLSQGAAEAAITGAGLVVGVVSNANSDVVPAGDVSAQNPGGGAFAAPASAVDITVSDGPADVVVPDVVGLSQGAAEAAITGAGLVVGVVSNANSDVVPAGDVSAQNPGGGAFAAPASAVDITVSDGPADVVVPDVVGLSQGAAEAAITGAGLVVGVVSNANSDVVPAGDVSAQNPGGGAFAAPASAVDITVSDGPADVVVPDVVNQAQAAAEAAITGAGLTVGVVSNDSSDTVLAGDVISQNPLGGAIAAAGSAVDLVISTGSAGVGPAALNLLLSRDVVTAGAMIDIVPQVTNSGGDPITPAPLINYAITFVPAEAAGTAPTEAAAVVSTSADTRGIYTVTGTVDGTAVSDSADFLVYRPAAESGQKAMYSGLSASLNSISANAEALAEALAGGDIAGVQTALNGMRVGRNAVNLVALQRSTAFAPEGGFLPSTGELTAGGFPQTADDTTLQIVLNNIVAKIQQTSSFYTALNPAGAGDDDAALAQLSTDLQTLLDQLNALNPTVHGWVQAKGLVNLLLGVALPQHLHAVVNRFETAILAEGIGVTDLQRPAEFYQRLTEPEERLARERLEPDAFYARQRQAFFSLAGMSVAANIQMKIISNVYGPMLHDLARSAAILVANDLLNEFVNNAGMAGLKTGASLSFHVWNQFNTFIEVTGANRTLPQRSDVFLIGTGAIAAVEGVFTALDPSDIEDLDDVWEFFEGVVSALEGAGEAFNTAHQLPSSAGPCFLFTSSSACGQLVYPVGFNSVNTCSGFVCVPQPVMVLVNNLDTGTWAFDIFSFNP